MWKLQNLSLQFFTIVLIVTEVILLLFLSFIENYRELWKKQCILECFYTYTWCFMTFYVSWIDKHIDLDPEISVTIPSYLSNSLILYVLRGHWGSDPVLIKAAAHLLHFQITKVACLHGATYNSSVDALFCTDFLSCFICFVVHYN